MPRQHDVFTQPQRLDLALQRRALAALTQNEQPTGPDLVHFCKRGEQGRKILLPGQAPGTDDHRPRPVREPGMMHALVGNLKQAVADDRVFDHRDPLPRQAGQRRGVIRHAFGDGDDAVYRPVDALHRQHAEPLLQAIAPGKRSGKIRSQTADHARAGAGGPCLQRQPNGAVFSDQHRFRPHAAQVLFQRTPCQVRVPRMQIDHVQAGRQGRCAIAAYRQHIERDVACRELVQQIEHHALHPAGAREREQHAEAVGNGLRRVHRYLRMRSPR